MYETTQRTDVIFYLPSKNMSMWNGPFLGVYYHTKDSSKVNNFVESMPIYAMLVEHPEDE